MDALVYFREHPLLEPGHVNLEEPVPPVDALGDPADLSLVLAAEPLERGARVVAPKDIVVPSDERREVVEHPLHPALLIRKAVERLRGGTNERCRGANRRQPEQP